MLPRIRTRSVVFRGVGSPIPVFELMKWTGEGEVSLGVRGGARLQDGVSWMGLVWAGGGDGSEKRDVGVFGYGRGSGMGLFVARVGRAMEKRDSCWLVMAPMGREIRGAVMFCCQCLW